VYGPDVDVNYASLVRAYAGAAQYVEKRFQGQGIVTGWPMTEILSDPRLGFVTEKIPAGPEQGGKAQVLVTADRIDRPQDLEALLQSRPHCLAKRFGEPGKSVSVYILDPAAQDCGRD